MIAHTELASTDPLATKSFLEQVFGWSFQRPQTEIIPYKTPGGAEGSIRKTRTGELPLAMNYILVDNLEVAEKKVVSFGGELVLPRVDVPNMGSFFWFKIPGGPVLACWADPPDRKTRQ
jgi:predicted enzyme related to lactoylglutathione lyase